MQTRKLGKTDLEIVPLIFGGNVFGWTIGEARSFEVKSLISWRGEWYVVHLGAIK